MIHPIVKTCLTTYQEIKMKATSIILTQVAVQKQRRKQKKKDVYLKKEETQTHS